MKNLKFLSLFILLSIVISSCKKTEVKPKKQIFKNNIDARAGVKEETGGA